MTERAAPKRDPRIDAPLPSSMMITVCNSCLTAACWQGKLFCDKSHGAGTEEISVKQLRKMGREHSSYWDADPRAINWRKHAED